MAMTWTSLTAAKGTAGSIANWVNYSKLDVNTVVDEAQSLLYSEGRLRTREMTTSRAFTMAVGSSYVALPTDFLDGIGPIKTATNNSRIPHKDASFIEQNRSYNETTGTLGTNPFTTTASSLSVNVALTAHGFTQDSIFNTSGASAFNGVTITGTFPITAIVDANNFTIDITTLGATPSGSGSGGGASVAYICDALTQGQPLYWGIWDEQIKFDQAFSQATLCRLPYYKQPALLSSTNATNFLTNRYPKLLRTACMAAAAEFMKDDAEYQKLLSRLTSAVEAVSVENDMQYRGTELDPLIP